MSEYQDRSDQTVSGWAVGGIGFAACMLLLIGAFQIVDGLSAIIDDEFFVVGKHYAFDLDTTTWGWIHLILGLIGLGVGIGILMGQTWGRILGIMVAVLTSLTNFAFLPYFPVWSLVILAFNALVIWALCTQLNYDEGA